MHLVQALAIAQVAIFCLAGPPYILDTIHGKTQPERATWFIWTVLGAIAFVSQVLLGASWSLVFTGLDTLGSLLVFLLSIRFGVGGWTRLDKAALVVAAVGVCVSLLARQPIIAIVGVIVADVSGALLTVRKTFLHPGSETTVSWLLIGVGSLCGVLSVQRLDAALLLYPVYLCIVNWSVPLAQIAGRAYQRSRRIVPSA
ncbi:MAG TPA: hypothetical protein VHC98_00345 [Candidatus Saccharimonadales bacterium]|nr:hypothetical protein [Candidatus Saccharimonadales bacterium]